VREAVTSSADLHRYLVDRWAAHRALAEAHDVTLSPHPHVAGGSVPFVFAAACTCGWRYGRNALKWTVKAVQQHYVDEELTNGRGLVDFATPEELLRAQ
jgi:hypothetical protein